MIVASGSGSTRSGFVVSNSLLSNTSAQLVQLGNGSSTGIRIEGDINLSNSSIGELFAYTSGAYDGAGSSITLPNSGVLYVNAGSVKTGSITNGNQAIFRANEDLRIDGKIDMPGATTYFYANKLNSSAEASINAYQVNFASIGNSTITISGDEGSDSHGFVISNKLLNNTHAQLLQIGNGSDVPPILGPTES